MYELGQFPFNVPVLRVPERNAYTLTRFIHGMGEGGEDPGIHFFVLLERAVSKG